MAIRRYVNDLTPDICMHMDSIFRSLSYFTETGKILRKPLSKIRETDDYEGIPMVAISQHHDPANIQVRLTSPSLSSLGVAYIFRRYVEPYNSRNILLCG